MYFEWDDETTPFIANSTLYSVDANDGTTLTIRPETQYTTYGAKSSVLFTMTDYDDDLLFIAIANQQSSATSYDASVDIIYVSQSILITLSASETTASTLLQSIETKNAQYVDAFTINGVQYLAIGQSKDDSSDDESSIVSLLAIYYFDLNYGYFIPFQTISISTATEITWANIFSASQTTGEDNGYYMAIGPCYDENDAKSGLYIYSWDS